jgi:hypothetical protein
MVSAQRMASASVKLRSGGSRWQSRRERAGFAGAFSLMLKVRMWDM